MKPARFRYHAPKTIEEAVDTLAEVAAEDGRVLAGGQSLVPIMAFRLARPAHLVDINGVEALRRLAVDGGRAHYPIRTRGTFCGSIAHADPAAEWCLVAAALGAEMVTRSAAGTRTILAQDFFRGIMTTALNEDELLTEVRLPVSAADSRFGFYEFNRRAGDFALGMALVSFRLQDGVICDPRVAVGGIEPQPRRIADAERALAGRTADRASFETAAAAVAAAVDPLEDAVTSATYRRDLARTVTRRALEQAAA